MKWHKPETAKNRGETQKMTPTSEMEFFLGDGPNGKVVAPGIVVICPIDKNRDHYTKKLTFGPKYPNFWVKKAHFRP